MRSSLDGGVPVGQPWLCCVPTRWRWRFESTPDSFGYTAPALRTGGVDEFDALPRMKGAKCVQRSSFRWNRGSFFMTENRFLFRRWGFVSGFHCVRRSRASGRFSSRWVTFPIRFSGVSRLDLYPATALDPGTHPGVVVRVATSSASTVHWSAGAPAPLRVFVRTSPNPVASGEHATLSVDGDAPASVAWRLGEDATAAGSSVTHRWTAPDEQPVSAMAIASDARAVIARAEVRVRPRYGESCALVSRDFRGFLWIPVLLLIQTRSRRWRKSGLRIGATRRALQD